jgi:hypothetical protein
MLNFPFPKSPGDGNNHANEIKKKFAVPTEIIFKFTTDKIKQFYACKI